eukprot:13593941-Alexandrium_andersonii.AAC.1
MEQLEEIDRRGERHTLPEETWRIFRADRGRPAHGPTWEQWGPKKGAKNEHGAYLEPRWEARAVIAG